MQIFLIGYFLDASVPTIEDLYRKEFNIDGVPVLLEILDTGGSDVRKTVGTCTMTTCPE